MAQRVRPETGELVHGHLAGASYRRPTDPTAEAARISGRPPARPLYSSDTTLAPHPPGAPRTTSAAASATSAEGYPPTETR